MAPERIDPKKPEYDIRADVWSLGITLVELATGAYPYKDCKTDFEVLTKGSWLLNTFPSAYFDIFVVILVLDSDPPSLPDNQGFSDEFRDFVRLSLTKDYRDRPKYESLVKHPFLAPIIFDRHYRIDLVNLHDVVEWFHRTTREAGIVLPTQDLPSVSTISLAPTSSATVLNR